MIPDTEEKREDRRWYIRMVGYIVMVLLGVQLVIMGMAGRWDYWQGWMFGGINLVLILIPLLWFRGGMDMALARERMHPGPGRPRWDKIIMILYLLAYGAVIVLGSLDAGRLRFSPALPIRWCVGICLVYGMTIVFMFWAKGVNPWFSSVVRIQTDRGQRVVEEGPYRYVRHPGYVGGILSSWATALVLGSLLALVPAAMMSTLLVIRTALEDRLLQKELPGYVEYAQRTRYRLLPGVW